MILLLRFIRCRQQCGIRQGRGRHVVAARRGYGRLLIIIRRKIDCRHLQSCSGGGMLRVGSGDGGGRSECGGIVLDAVEKSPLKISGYDIFRSCRLFNYC